MNWQARSIPERKTLEGRYCRLEPLDLRRHAEDLYAASMAEGAEDRFRYLPDSPIEKTEFREWLVRVSALQDPLFYAVVDAGSGKAGGRQALMRITPEHGCIEIGHVLWGPDVARTRIATEAVFLMAQYVFDGLAYRRLEWKCNNRNEASKRAALRFGFQYEGLFRQHMVVKGENRDTAWFAMLDEDWPRLRAAYKQWLDPGNFDESGRQKQRLESLR